MSRIADPCVLVIFGANGDLTKRKLLPALVNLDQGGLLPEKFAVVGVVREQISDEAFRERMGREVMEHATNPVDPERWGALSKRLYAASGDLTDPDTYRRLATLLEKIDAQHGTSGNAVFYLSTPPTLFQTIIAQLGASGLASEEGGRFRRVIIEKPFGRDLESARSLNAEIGKVLAERQSYRIDHYLGKETVQNILVFRFANGLFEPTWNNHYIDHVQITVSEKLGIEGRGKYYDESGALRDMIANHLIQLLAFTAMEPPISFDADAVRDEKSKVIRAIQPMTGPEVMKRVVRAQYEGYRQEPNVSPESTTETFVAMKILIDNWRWADVPFYIRTGKKLAERTSVIAVHFKRAPFALFRETEVERLRRNVLVIYVQPKEGIALTFGAKVPGPDLKLSNVDMDFDYSNYFGAKPSTGYETLLYDCMIGDQTLFQRADNVDSAWTVMTPVLKEWQQLGARGLATYEPGSWGPREAEELLEKDGRHWWAAETPELARAGKP